MLKPDSKQAKTPPKRVDVNIGRPAVWENDSTAFVMIPPLQNRLLSGRVARRLSAPGLPEEIKKMWVMLTSV
jgi:hypothetical protein